MEKRLPLIFFILVFLICGISFVCPQIANQEQKIQLLLWAEKEAYPGVEWDKDTVDFENSTENPYALPVSRLKKISPYFIEGMLYGWKVEYTPYDKSRGVKEYLEIEAVQELTDGELNSIQYKNSAFKDEIGRAHV